MIRRSWQSFSRPQNLQTFAPKLHFSPAKRTFFPSFASAAKVQFNLADIGEGITECELVQWFVKEGSQISQFDKICEVQSDKATVEITSRYDGLITKLHYKPGDVAKVGSPLIDIESAEDGDGVEEKVAPVVVSSSPVVTKPFVSSSPVVTKPVVSSSPVATTQPAHGASSSPGETLATPAVRRLSRELHVDLAKVDGTGKNGRIHKEDVLAFSEQSKSPSSKQPAVSTSNSNSGKKTVVLLGPIQKAMVRRMQESLQIPHFGFSDEVSFESLKEARKSLNHILKSRHQDDSSLKKISFMPLLIKSFSMALERYPLLNAEFIPNGSDAESKPHLLYKPHHNIGIAMDGPQGLVVPNVARVNEKSIFEIAQDLSNLQAAAQKNSLPLEAFANTTVSISNIGNLGGRVLHPVIPSGTVCIAAIGRAQTLPRYHKNEAGVLVLGPEEIVTISFSADHRVVDGATVAKFFLEWKKLIENPYDMLLTLK